MARLENTTAFTVTARMRHGVVLDPRYGISFDGLLAGLYRDEQTAWDEGDRPSDYDQGLATLSPEVWELPLLRCTLPNKEDWHWMCTSSLLLDAKGEPISVEPDIRRLLQVAQQNRLEQSVRKLPKTIPAHKMRYRNKITPVVSYPCETILWHAIGDPGLTRKLLEEIDNIGSRRGSGEGAVIEWNIVEHPEYPQNLLGRFGHSFPNGRQGRPLPEICVQTFGFPKGDSGIGGVRPPLFHSSTQRELVFPK